MLRLLTLPTLVTMVLISSSFGISSSESVDQKGQADNKRTKLEFDAVHSIHVQLDDDNNGDVDIEESKEFLQHELGYLGHDSKRHSKFHSGDGFVSVDELWKAWTTSEVYKWTPNEVVDWLNHVVHLPQYADVFIKNKIYGRYLPRLASSNDDILLNKLKISNVIDRKKIALRAMDVVLFGAPKGHNYLKDLVLGLAVLIAMAGFWFSNVQKRKAQKQMGTMMKDIEYLQEAEKNLTGLQSRLHEAEANHQIIQQEKYQLESNLKNEIETAKCEAQRLREAREDDSGEIHTRLKLAEQELDQVSEALRKAEKELEFFSFQMSSSLQKWLQITYQKEVKTFVYRRAAALRKMENAKEATNSTNKIYKALHINTHIELRLSTENEPPSLEDSIVDAMCQERSEEFMRKRMTNLCDRINRKRNSVFGSLRLVHDQNIDEVDKKILSARSALAEVTNELEELQHRWQQIETCCRLDLGVSSLLSDATDASSPSLAQAVALYGKVGALNYTKSNSRESVTLRRVVTYPSFPSLDDISYHSVSKSKVSCIASDTTYVNEPGVTDEPGFSMQNVSSSEHSNNAQVNDINYDQDDINNDINYDQDDTEYEKPVSQKTLPSPTSDQNTSGIPLVKKINNGENKTTHVNKAKKNSDKFFLHKKKWWSRNKQQHSLETDPESETDSVLENHASLPILHQVKDSMKHSYNDDKDEDLLTHLNS